MAGLKLNAAKCQVWSEQQPAAAARLADRLGMAHAPGGLRVLGGWLGSDDSSFAGGVAEAANTWVSELLALDIPAQAKLLLLRKSGWARPLYLARSCSTQAATMALHDAHEALLSAVESLAQLGPGQVLGEHAEMQASLPVAVGGLGLTKLTGSHCAAARVSSALQAQALLAGSHSWAQPLSQGSHASAEVEVCWAAVQEERLLGLEQAGLQAAAAGETPWGSGSLQSAYGRAYSAWLQAALVEDLQAEGDAAGARRVLSASDPASGAWMHALPTKGQQVGDRVVADELCLRLGLACVPLVTDKCSAACGGKPDSLGHHALSCRTASGARNVRHTLVLEQWRRVAAAAGVGSGQEPRLDRLVLDDGDKTAETLREVGAQRGDILFSLRPHWVVGDVVVNNTWSTQHHGSQPARGQAAEAAEARKRLKYKAYMGAASTAAELVPMGLDTVGAWGAGSKRVLQMLVDHAASEGRDGAAVEFKARVWIGMSRMRGNSRMLAVANNVAGQSCSTKFVRYSSRVQQDALESAGARVI